MPSPLYRLFYRAILVVWPVYQGLLLPPAAAALQAAQKPAAEYVQKYAIQSQQEKIAVQKALTRPFRVDVQPREQGVRPDSPATLKVVLRNGNNQEAAATEKLTLTVTATAPSHAKLTRSLEIAPGASSGDVSITPQEPGLWKLEVRESHDHLKSGSNYLLVSSAAQQSTRRPSSAAKKTKSSRPAPAVRPPGGALMFAPRLLLAAYTPPYGPPQGPSVGNSQPALESGIILAVSGESDARVRADGMTPVRIQVFLTSPRTSDLRVWLDVSDGQLASPMVTITAGNVEADVDWTSTTVGKATVSIKDTTPKIAGQETPSATVEFVDPIVAISFVQPLKRFNIVEQGNFDVRFLDRHNKPVTTHVPYSYSFRANSAHVRLKPESDLTKLGASEFATEVAATALGPVTIEAAVPGFDPTQISFEVTGLLLLGLCALGGALGGLVNHFDRKQKKGLPASLLTGTVVALPVTWLYVCVGLPNVSAVILHSQLSAVMVAVIAGVFGAKGLKLAAKKAGFNLFDGSTEGKSSGATA